MTGAPVLLVLETTIVGVAAALARIGGGQPEILWEGAHPANAGSVAAIATLIAGGATKSGVALSGVSGIVVANGPGSFTGIKVGLAYAMGVRTARIPAGLPILTVSALAAAARRLAGPSAAGGAPVALLLPATRTHGFLAVAPPFGAASSELCEAAGLGRRLADWPAGAPIMITGEWPAAAAALAAGGLAAGTLAPAEVSRQAIYGMAEAGAGAWPAGFRDEEPAPRYLRLSTAEEKLAAETR